MRLLGSTSLSAHHGRVRFGWTVALSRLRRDGWLVRCKFIDMNADRDGGVARDVGAAGQAALGMRWCSNVAAAECR